MLYCNSYLTHSTILFNNDKTSFYLTKMSAEQCFQFSFPKLSFLGWKCFVVVILETEDSHSQQNKWIQFWARRAPPQFPFLAGWQIDKMKMNGLVSLSGLHSQAQWNASLQKIKWNNREIDYGWKLRLSSITEQVPVFLVPDWLQSFIPCAFLFQSNKMCNVIVIHYQTR